MLFIVVASNPVEAITADTTLPLLPRKLGTRPPVQMKKIIVDIPAKNRVAVVKSSTLTFNKNANAELIFCTLTVCIESHGHGYHINLKIQFSVDFQKIDSTYE